VRPERRNAKALRIGQVLDDQGNTAAVRDRRLLEESWAENRASPLRAGPSVEWPNDAGRIPVDTCETIVLLTQIVALAFMRPCNKGNPIGLQERESSVGEQSGLRKRARRIGIRE
jgi:hypothetical protein